MSTIFFLNFLFKDSRDVIRSPHQINDTFNKLSNNQQKIVDVVLGYSTTWIISVEMREEKGNESDDEYDDDIKEKEVEIIKLKKEMAEMQQKKVTVHNTLHTFAQKYTLRLSQIYLISIQQKDAMCYICLHSFIH